MNITLAARQLQFPGKLIRSEDSFILKQLLTTWVNHKHLPGWVLTTTKTSYVKSLQRLVYPKNAYRKDTDTGKQVPVEIRMGRFGSLKYWIEDATCDKMRILSLKHSWKGFRQNETLE